MIPSAIARGTMALGILCLYLLPNQASAQSLFPSPPTQYDACATQLGADPVVTVTGDHMTNEFCAFECWANGKRFANTTNRNECQCNNTLPRMYGNQCNVTCLGAPNQEFCGGGSRAGFSVYRIRACYNTANNAALVLPSLIIRLSFGRNIPNPPSTIPKGEVGDQQWLAYLNNVLLPKMQGGNIVSSTGVFLDPQTRVQETEKSFVVTTMITAQAASANPGQFAQRLTDIDAAIRTYNETFAQYSVLKEMYFTCADFDNLGSPLQ